MNSTRIRFSHLVQTLNSSADRFIDAVLRLLRANKAFWLSVAFTLVFYWPTLIDGSANSGFVFGGDIIGFYVPEMVKTQSLISTFNFTGLDFSHFNGSSDYFLSSNFFACYPLLVIHSLLSDPHATLLQTCHLLMVMIALNSFLSCYFSLKLLSRYFSFPFELALLVAVVFAFSPETITGLSQPEFIFSVATLPWAAYAALSYAEAPSARNLVLSSIPIVMALLGGYIPLAAAALAMSAAIVAFRILLIDEMPTSTYARRRKMVTAAMPYVLAAIVVAPYLYAAHSFLLETQASGRDSVFFSAHQLAEQPQSLLRIISFFMKQPGPFYEFTVTWGTVALTIASLFFLGRKAVLALTSREWIIFKGAAVLYVLTVLAIYGEFSPISDFVYYFVPQIGKMHIYQRFLLPAHLFFAVMVALMVKALVVARPQVGPRVALALLAMITTTAAYVFSHSLPVAKDLGLNNHIIFELILAFLFTLSLLMRGRKHVYWVTIFLLFLPPLSHIYLGTHKTLAAQQKRLPIILDDDQRADFVEYLQRFNDKAVIKYVDLTSRWSEVGAGTETFPKNFPDMMLNSPRLSSFGGFNFYLSARQDYMQKMPQVGDKLVMVPDLKVLSRAGVDFALLPAADAKESVFADIFAKTSPKNIFNLPNGVVAFSVREISDSRFAADTLYDNGFFRITRAGSANEDRTATATAAGHAGSVSVSDFSTNFANRVHLAFESPNDVAVQYLFSDNPRLSYDLNGKPAVTALHNGMRSMDVPAGKSTIDIYYVNWPLRFFWFVYALFALACLAALAATLFSSAAAARDRWHALRGDTRDPAA